MLKNLKNKKGFTLVELIIVIAILGILMLIAVPYLLGIQQRFQVNADKKSAAQIGKAVRVWYTEYRTDKAFRVAVGGTAVDEGTVVYATSEQKGAIPVPGKNMAPLAQVTKMEDYVDIANTKPTSLRNANDVIDDTQCYFVGLVGGGSTEKIIISIAPADAEIAIDDDAAPTAANVAYDGKAQTVADGDTYPFDAALAYLEP